MSYIIVNIDRKEYINPVKLTGCSRFCAFSVFPVIGTALLLLTHHNDNIKDGDPDVNYDPLIGSWAGGKIVTTSIFHIGRDMTGNYKCGNLCAVAQQKFKDITSDIIESIRKYESDDYYDEERGREEVEELNENIRFVLTYNGGEHHTVIQERSENGEWRTIKKP